MEMALSFNSVTLTPVTHQNSLWIRAVELACALGYSSEKSISNIYKRNQDEFSNEMSVVINLMTTGTPVQTRIFSLRGCHLLAMFARTPVAKAFRKWVLDVLDKLAEQERLAAESKAIPDASRLSTPDSRKPLRSLVRAWAQIAGVHYGALWPQVKAHFQLSRIDDLPESWIPDALAFVQGKIDQCGKALQPAPAIASAPESTLTATTLEAKTYACGKRFFDEVSKLRRDAENLREVLHLFARPGARDAVLPSEKQMLYDNANEAANVAVTSLNQTIYALRMIYNIRAHVSFSR